MGFFAVVKALLAPALIALALYTLGAYVFLPLYRRHHSRYSEYLPLANLGSQTSGLRSRIWGVVTRVLVPRSLLHGRGVVDGSAVEGGGGGGGGSGGGGSTEDHWILDPGEGERMVGFGRDVERLDRGRDERGGRVGSGVEIDSLRRLSRDLEEGFRDESSEEEGGEGMRRGPGGRR
ncbi:hypothetical protein LTR02_005817 [Friedmanniomyces endolithicus]|nr:hypothetical protein LTR59_007716 [Friedmanniomyces endolithicus]KAK0805401.1 hypothetical protein LTR75_007350 [Friedmanniomyces endolithicus]KAK0906833.1 hypothetical protein LTR02_005817 [Friedmanniomyces endolithicus]KAK0960672.1 hypothetical protein LTS01_020791 [Friedmanniomyces endolithicus]